MQRYRINYPLLFGLIAVCGIVGSISFFLIHPWQVNRNAEWFRERAESAIAENDSRTAFDYQAKYVRYRKSDDEARIKLANLAIDVTELSDVNANERGTAYSILQDTVLKTGDPELRLKLAELLIAGGRPSDALPHIAELLAEDPGNTELQALRIRSLFAMKDFSRASDLAFTLIGYDKTTNSFDTEKATAADQPEIYALLAATLSEVNKEPEQARQIIDRMVEVNPESHDAHLKRSMFLQSIGKKEEANAALAKAYELNPTDAEVLKRLGQFALINKEFDKAHQYLSEGLKSHPEDILFFKLLAIAEMQRGNTAEALAILDQGVKKFGERDSIDLILYKIDALFQAKDFASVNKEIAILEKMKVKSLKPMTDFQKARIKWHEQKWAESVKEFKQLRPMLFQFPDAQALAGVMLGGAYEKLGQPDLAKQTYNIVLQDRPEDSRALAGLQRTTRRVRPSTPDNSSNAQGSGISQLARKMLALPKNLQDWESIDSRIKKYVEENDLPKVVELLFQAQVFLDRKMYKEARGKVREAAAIDKDNLNVELAAVKVMWLEPDTRVEKALKVLDRIVNKYGDSLQTRALRAEILVTSEIENVPEQIRSLAENLDGWNDQDKVQLYLTLGKKLLQLGKMEGAQNFWRQAALLAPNDLPVRMQLFDVALQRRDDTAMREAQNNILELVGNKEDASYIITEVKRRIIGFGKEQVTREELLEARKMLDAAMLQRPEWNQLHIIYGQLLLVLQQDLDIALQRLDDALRYGPPNMNVLSLHVQLLAKQGRFQEAREKMNLMPPELRDSLLGQVGAEVLLETGAPEAGFAAAQKIADQQAENATTQKWFARLATKAGRPEVSEEAWKKAIELNPAEPDSWSQLMILYAQQKKLVELQNLLRQAHLSLDAEFIPLLTAKTYELQGRWQNAENLYLTAYGERLHEIPLAKRMAEFYLLWKAANPANTAKASVYLNRILRAFNEGKASPQDMPHVTWARLQAARILAGTGDYKKSQQALKLLNQGAVEGELSVENQTLQGEILASLKDPVSQAQAIQLLTGLRSNNQLDKKGTLLLAKLLHGVGDSQASEDLMIDALANFPGDQEVRATQVSLLIEHGDYDAAQRRLNRLRGAADKKVYFQLLARLSFKKGDQSGVKKALNNLLPNNLEGSLDPTQVVTVLTVAQIAAEYGEIELAEKLFTRYVKSVPAASFVLTRFHALYGKVDTAIDLMKKSLARQADAVVALSAQMLRKRRPEFGDKYDEDINNLVAKALRDDPESAQRRVTWAEVLEIQQKYNESIAAYDKLLKSDDMPPRQRAAASNNLAFVLALKEQRLEEAESLADHAIEYYGPLASLLDTRGVVRIAQKQYDLAIEDLTLAVTVDRQPLTLYHLARALLLAGDQEAALKRWQEAKAQGLEKESISELERSAYDEFASKIQQL